ncbi:MetQ/NlpA family ABC transporter substrate-binding protein [Timonella senegalensis]|uniref:MetQ/NlpA family ABC transporter substrate-binding protein n=1 Tax=Timonella senegalensis TaxID=1465825 RepID=UPI002FDF2834
MSRKSVLKSVAAAALTATLAFSLSACGADDKGSAEEGADTKGTKENPVTIGVVGAEDYWATFETEAEKQGLFVDIKDLGDYQLPNKAVTAGELDLNQFQHLLFLANYNVDANEDLTPIAGTAVYPLGVYSKKHTSVDSITLKDGGSAFSTELDVLPESKVKVTPVDATQTVLALDSVEASVVNNDFLADAGLKATDAIYKDSAEAEGARPYINIWVTRAEDKDNAVYKKVIDVYKSQTVQDGVLAASGGTAAFANQSGEELTGFLKDIEEQIKASK